MQGLIYKVGERRNEWKCCFCCHVRTGTIFLGIWHLMLHVLALSVIAVVLRHPEILIDFSRPVENEYKLDRLDIKADNAYKPFIRSVGNQNLNVGVVVTFCTFAITLLMVYGAIKGKPAYLMPFFCLQVFDFCIASLTALSYLCYLPDMHRVIAESPRIPMQPALLNLPPQCLALVVLLTFVLIMLVKAYFIGVVWSCYKYLTLRMVSTQRTIHFIDTETPPDFQGLLPDYETAVKYPTPPPSYSTATGGHFSPNLSGSMPSPDVSSSLRSADFSASLRSPDISGSLRSPVLSGPNSPDISSSITTPSTRSLHSSPQ